MKRNSQAKWWMETGCNFNRTLKAYHRFVDNGELYGIIWEKKKTCKERIDGKVDFI